MSVLEDMSNDELRIRLLEYGFENIPVTQTTRKVLLKKLKNAMDTQKTKIRRETVAVIKSSDDEDISEGKREKTPNRRATIAVTEKIKKVAVTSSNGSGSNSRSGTPVKAISSRRSSSRTTPAKEPQKSTVSSTANILPLPLQEDSDDDIVEIPFISRRSKTPTMAKSETVRTSYKTTTVENVVDDTIVDDYSPEPVIQELKPTVNRRKTYSTATTADFAEPPIRNATPTKFGRTTLTTSFNPSVNYNFKHNDDEDDDDEQEKLDITEKDAPYLSNFAKRLSTLKAEPLDVGLNKYKSLREEKYEKPAATNYSYNRYSQYSSVPPTATTSSSNRQSVVNQMARDFDKIDRTYSVRKYIYIALLLMIIIAIYVLLFL